MPNKPPRNFQDGPSNSGPSSEPTPIKPTAPTLPSHNGDDRPRLRMRIIKNRKTGLADTVALSLGTTVMVTTPGQCVTLGDMLRETGRTALLLQAFHKYMRKQGMDDETAGAIIDELAGELTR